MVGTAVRPRSRTDRTPDSVSRGGTPRRVLILVENLSVPFDRRVWREACTLRDAGYRVAVISPRGTTRDTERKTVRDGVTIYRYRPAHIKRGLLSYVVEYLHALAMQFALSMRVAVEHGFDIIHICNPPDLLFLVTLPYKLAGKKVVFDHHDLGPEVYSARSGGAGTAGGLLHRGMLLLERVTFGCADCVLSTNDSYRAIALGRGRKPPEQVFVVRNGPALDELRQVQPRAELRAPDRFLIAYVGIMGPQDGVDLLLRSLACLAGAHGRHDFDAVLLGDGPAYAQLRALTVSLGLEGVVQFTGRVSFERVLETVAAADVCVCPDPKTPFNDHSTLVKVLEYMGLGKPIVAFDLTETVVSAGCAALYAERNDPASLAARIEQLLDSDELRASMGAVGRRRIETKLAWDYSVDQLISAYRTLHVSSD